MLSLVQHLTKSSTYETLKQVQGDKLGLFMRPSIIIKLQFPMSKRSFLNH